jgi:hypothetical protein
MASWAGIVVTLVAFAALSLAILAVRRPIHRPSDILP